MQSTGFELVLSDLPVGVEVGRDGRPDPGPALRQIMQNPRAASAAAASSGLVVGERELHVDGPRRRQAFRFSGALALLAVLLLVAGLLLGPYAPWRGLAGVSYLAGAFCLPAALFSLGPTRAYDSQLLVLTYRSVPGALPPTGASESTETYELAAACVQVASQNGWGRSAGRSVRSLLPAPPELASVGPRVLALIRED